MMDVVVNDLDFYLAFFAAFEKREKRENNFTATTWTS